MLSDRKSVAVKFVVGRFVGQVVVVVRFVVKVGGKSVAVKVVVELSAVRAVVELVVAG